MPSPRGTAFLPLPGKGVLLLPGNKKTPPLIDDILQVLRSEYPRAGTALRFKSPFELLIAVILSAQTTDKQVNRITEKLFQKVKGPADILSMGIHRLEEQLQGCGLYRQKSRQIIEACRLLCQKHGGEVPSTREALMELPGVGRKTANVVLNTVFGIPALAVDTHVMRVSRRLGLAKGKGPLEVEKELGLLLPPEAWGETHHRLIAHGRRFCRARKPLCERCPLSIHCSFVS